MATRRQRPPRHSASARTRPPSCHFSAASSCRRPTTPTCGSIVGFKEEGGTDYYKVKWRPYYDDDDSVASAFASCRLVLSSPARSARLPSSFSCGLSLAQAAREACRKGTAKHRAVGARPRERLCHEPICWALLPYGRGRLSAWPLRRLCCGALFVFGTVVSRGRTLRGSALTGTLEHLQGELSFLC